MSRKRQSLLTVHLYEAAVLAMTTLETLTTKQFAHGEDKPAREALASAIKAYEEAKA